ncbi:hypothetical protein [Marinagarivorans cellulosilyticus]|uniref:hypothetical protein n=1 Tax=Marinagarivorans cellulosilyticus TaxID=2721545 RepID=UPI001F450FF8|nr:hypothetical protein [Marinagarivorans cellulosilyticus]
MKDLSFEPKYFVKCDNSVWTFNQGQKIPSSKSSIGSELVIAEAKRIEIEGHSIQVVDHWLEGGHNDSFLEKLKEKHL